MSLSEKAVRRIVREELRREATRKRDLAYEGKRRQLEIEHRQDAERIQAVMERERLNEELSKGNAGSWEHICYRRDLPG